MILSLPEELSWLKCALKPIFVLHQDSYKIGLSERAPVAFLYIEVDLLCRWRCPYAFGRWNEQRIDCAHCLAHCLAVSLQELEVAILSCSHQVLRLGY